LLSKQWDTLGGRERFRSLSPIYFRHANVLAVVFDISCDESLRRVRTWIDEAFKYAESYTQIALVGAKLDLDTKGQRRALQKVAQAIANEYSIPYYELSSKTGQGVDEFFLDISSRAYRQLKLDPAIAPIPASATNGKEEQGGGIGAVRVLRWFKNLLGW
jgi:GTPase SAR1 family protein